MFGKKGSKILKLPSVRNCFTLAMTNKLVFIINSFKVPKIKNILLYELKFLVQNYSFTKFLGTPLPVLLLWAVQPVQSLSACTTVHFTFTFTFTCTPLRAVQPVRSLSACTTLHLTFTFTSTPPMGRTACTEPQCL